MQSLPLDVLDIIYRSVVIYKQHTYALLCRNAYMRYKTKHTREDRLIHFLFCDVGVVRAGAVVHVEVGSKFNPMVNLTWLKGFYLHTPWLLNGNLKLFIGGMEVTPEEAETHRELGQLARRRTGNNYGKYVNVMINENAMHEMLKHRFYKILEYYFGDYRSLYEFEIRRGLCGYNQIIGDIVPVTSIKNLAKLIVDWSLKAIGNWSGERPIPNLTILHFMDAEESLRFVKALPLKRVDVRRCQSVDLLRRVPSVFKKRYAEVWNAMFVSNWISEDTYMHHIHEFRNQ